MALTERTEVYVMVYPPEYHNAVQVKTARVILDDGKEITRTWHAEVLLPDANLDGRPESVVNIAKTTWTDEVKSAYASYKAASEASFGQ